MLCFSSTAVVLVFLVTFALIYWPPRQEFVTIGTQIKREQPSTCVYLEIEGDDTIGFWADIAKKWRSGHLAQLTYRYFLEGFPKHTPLVTLIFFNQISESSVLMTVHGLSVCPRQRQGRLWNIAKV